ncbi:tRNA (adenosine(37)-N6)-threonylcarbamoyltransferase complex ATPase subunit type 1 TsaE [Emticicia sp. SJ17W-69]|uniref:tRNA (adenosine(37)-N6)-threonylcarbamoyltransferase complex ATPase subunit type 1 TsaE n=1 Tax=Emticicia sp. SJ17W-69 TaxID=3421657 RepID=UPI003EC04A6C
MIYRIEDLPIVAKEVIALAKSKTIWIFEGEMGVGKTTLIKAICKELGVKTSVQSPTFSIVNEYLTDSGKTIFHFDFYRLKNETEALDFGIEEYFDSGNICLLEWAEKIESLLPEDCFLIRIALNVDNELARNLNVS